MARYIVWIKERGQGWEPNGDGPMGPKTAERVAREIKEDHRIPTKALPVGETPSE